MRGSIFKRSKSSWSLIVDLGRDASGKRRQTWHRFAVPRGVSMRDATKQAEAELAKLIHEIDKGTYVDTSKTTLADYLHAWLTNVTPLRDPQTIRTYSDMIEHVAAAPIGRKPLQKVTASDLEFFYATVAPRKARKSSNGKLAPATIQVIHTVINQALRIAVRDRVLAFNPAPDARNRPKRAKQAAQHTARECCWTADEARCVLAAAKDAGSQVHAFFATAIDSGMRRSELLGLTWSNVDLDNGTITICQQLTPQSITVATFKPPKTRRVRKITIGSQTVAALREHRKQQRELMMKNRATYQAFDLVFAKEDVDLQRPSAQLGQPCPALTTRHYNRVIRTCGVRRIKIHGMRHTSATLSLHNAGLPVKVVADRLGHSKASMTLDTYTHSDTAAQQDAAVRLDAVLAAR